MTWSGRALTLGLIGTCIKVVVEIELEVELVETEVVDVEVVEVELLVEVEVLVPKSEMPGYG